MTPHLQPFSKILVLGCGNSSLTADLFSAGFQRITSVDLSPAVIERMQKRAAEKVSSRSFDLPESQAHIDLGHQILLYSSKDRTGSDF